MAPDVESTTRLFNRDPSLYGVMEVARPYSTTRRPFKESRQGKTKSQNLAASGLGSAVKYSTNPCVLDLMTVEENAMILVQMSWNAYSGHVGKGQPVPATCGIEPSVSSTFGMSKQSIQRKRCSLFGSRGHLPYQYKGSDTGSDNTIEDVWEYSGHTEAQGQIHSLTKAHNISKTPKVSYIPAAKTKSRPALVENSGPEEPKAEMVRQKGQQSLRQSRKPTSKPAHANPILKAEKGSGRKKNECGQQSKPPARKSVLKQVIERAQQTSMKTPQYQGPHAMLLNSSGTDPFANPENIVLKEDGSFGLREAALILGVNRIMRRRYKRSPNFATKNLHINHVATLRNNDTIKMPREYDSFDRNAYEGEPSRIAGAWCKAEWTDLSYDERAQSYLTSKSSAVDEYKRFRLERNRDRSPTPPFDDYPIPDIDDMTIDPRFMTYTRKRSRLQTDQTPCEYEGQRISWIKRRNARREKEDREMFLGLKAFKGLQRGWDRKPETERRAAEEKRRSETQLAQSPTPRTLSPYPRTTAKELEANFEGHQSQYTMDQLAAEDYVTLLGERNYGDMMKTKWNPELVKEMATDARRIEEETRLRHEGRSKTKLDASSDQMLEEEQGRCGSSTIIPGIKIRFRARSNTSPSRKRNMSQRRSQEESFIGYPDTPVSAARVIRKTKKHSSEMVMSDLDKSLIPLDK